MNHFHLKQTWRWFGPADTVTLQHIKQAGAQGIVTALHHIPHGEIWPVEEIQKRQNELSAAGFEWDVVESLTVHEDIKTHSGHYEIYIEKYKQSLVNLSQCGIKIVTYNFMPVNDWTRTSIDYPMKDGSKALYFNWPELAMFDVYILQRPDAEKDYPAAIVDKAKKLFADFTEDQKAYLISIVLFGIPGEAKLSVAAMGKEIERYKNIDHATLKNNLKYFLQQVAPVATACGIKLAIHPDDPPYDILGLPRIASTQKDLADILSFTNEPSNGLCFCTGSLGANTGNNLPEMIQQFAEKIHFVHLRNVIKDAEGNFYEADHLEGDVDMYEVMKQLLRIQKTAALPIPFRPDHGHQMLDDLSKTTNPGYSAIGRLRGLAELRGLELGVLRSNVI